MQLSLQTKRPGNKKAGGQMLEMFFKTGCLFMIIQTCSCLTQVPGESHSGASKTGSDVPPNASNRPQVAAKGGASHFQLNKIEVPPEAIGSDPIDHVTRAANNNKRNEQPAGPRRSRRLAGPFNFLSPPKLVQWSKEPVQYYEGSTLVLSCSLSQSGGEQPQLKFAWFRNGKPIGQSSSQQRLSIETLADYSFLRLAELRPADSGSYACVASNSHGQEDRTTTQVIVNVKLKWISSSGSSNNNALADDLHVNRTLLDGETGHQLVKSRAAQTVVFECNVSGGQQPQVRWFRLMAPNAKARPSGSSKSPRQKLEQGLFLDETQLKMTLNQLDAVQGDTQMQRYELTNDALVGKSSQLYNESKQFKWRIETNPAPNNNQAQEVFSRLILDRVEPGASGLYGCDASSTSTSLEQHSNINSQLLLVSQESSSMGASRRAHSIDKLHRFFGLLVNGGLRGPIQVRSVRTDMETDSE